MKKKVTNIVLSILIVVSIFFEFSLFKSLTKFKVNDIYNINIIAMFIIGIVINYMLNKYSDKKITKFKIFLAIMFSIFMIVGESLVVSKTITLIWKNIACILLSIVKLTGYSSLFILAFKLLDETLSKRKNPDLKPKKKIFKWYIEKFNNYPFRTSFITILIIISIYIFAFYPIVLSPDPSNQIKMFFNVKTKYVDWSIIRDPLVTITNHHPVLQTWLLGYSIKAGQFIFNDNFGLFIYTFIQTIIYTSILAYTIYYASRNNVKSKYRFILLLIYCIVPMFALYSVSAVKDTLYTAFMIMYILFIYDYIKNYKDKKISIGYLIHIFFITTLMCLFRHNGIYIVIAVLPFIIFINRLNIFRVTIPFILSICSVFGFNKVLIPTLGIGDTSPREMLSIPFQQTARYVKYYSDELSEDDIEIIDSILGYDDLGERYNPRISDPVKNKYNKYTTSEEFKEYLGVWFKGLKSHPLCYIEATLNNTYGYFYPNTHRWYVYTEYDKRVTDNDLLDYHYIENRGWLRNILTGYANMFPYVPIFGIICSTGICLWIILIIMSYILKKEYRKYIIVLLPMFLSWAICMVSPANTYFRYVMPITFVLPVLVLLFLSNVEGEKNEEK